MKASASRVALVAVTVSAIAISAFWAGGYFARADAAGDAAVLDTPRPTTTSGRGTLAEEYVVPVDVTWPQDLTLPYLGARGVVTSALTTGGAYGLGESGGVLATVDGLPVVTVEGTHPAYRTLATGMAGEDVHQLQQFLVAEGFLDARAVDGRFGAATRAAVQAWWETHGIRNRTDVPVGSVVFMAGLPRSVALGEFVEVGGLIDTGATLVSAVAPVPLMRVTLTEIQESRYLAEGAAFSLMSSADRGIALQPQGDLQIVEGSATLVLEPDAADLAELLATLVVGPPTRLSAAMTVTEPRTGTIVPVAALQVTDSDAATATVLLPDGGTMPVTVLATVGGEAIVEGLDPGVTIVVGS